MNTRILRTVCFIVMLSMTGLIIGCSQTKNTKTDSESIDLSTDKGTDIATTKQAEIDQLKKQAEEHAEMDRNNILEALGDAQSDERWGAAIGFIKDRYPDYFSTEELLQNSIEYGHYLTSVYKDSEGIDNGSGRYFEMGKLISEAAQTIYLGNNTSEDELILEKMKELEEQLIFFFGEYYGDLSAGK